MSLNIKNERVHELAREAARRTGKSQTSVIEEALVNLLREYDADPQRADRQRRLEIIRDVSLAWEPLPPGGDDDNIRDVEDLYDPTTGLPA